MPMNRKPMLRRDGGEEYHQDSRLDLKMVRLNLRVPWLYR